MRRDPYVILGVGKDSIEAEIKKAHRKLCKRHHPDKGGDPDKFKDVQWAYEVLTDPEKLKAWENGQDPDKAMRDQHVALVCRVIMELIPRLNLKLDNLIDAARQTIGRMKDKATDQIGDLIMERVRLEEAIGRVTGFAEDNLVAEVLHSAIEKVNQTIKLVEAEVENLNNALKLLDDYSYRTDVPEWLKRGQSFGPDSDTIHKLIRSIS